MRLVHLFPLLFACSSEPLQPEPELAVLRELRFVREDPEGVSSGMNLDGFVSEVNDGRSCFKEDFTSPDGEPGIDNELARLLALVDVAGENAVESLVQGSINEGRLLMIIEVTPKGDTADVRVLRGADVPLLGADGLILSGQTLGLDAEPLLGQIEGVPLTDGSIVTEPFSLRLPVVVFSQLYEVQMPKANLRFTVAPDGSIERGLIAGGIPIEQLLTVLRTASMFAGDFEALFGDAIRESGDLDRDDAGACATLSAAVEFDAVQAFTFE
jgi:hypothetical protein